MLYCLIVRHTTKGKAMEYDVTAEIKIQISDQDVLEADGDVEQAVQNRVGHTGASVVEIIDGGGLATA